MAGSVNGQSFVMPGLDPGIHVFFVRVRVKDVDGRDIGERK
jgi:hypothetical protein